MMTGTNWEAVGQLFGVLGVVVASAWGMRRGHKVGDGKAPEVRPPPQNEVKAALDSLRAGVDRHAETIGDDINDIRRQMDRIERGVERIENRAHIDAMFRDRTTPPTFGG